MLQNKFNLGQKVCIIQYDLIKNELLKTGGLSVRWGHVKRIQIVQNLKGERINYLVELHKLSGGGICSEELPEEYIFTTLEEAKNYFIAKLDGYGIKTL